MNAAPKPAHSRLGASSYERWGACPASIRLSEGVEKTSSVYAEEGTQAHGLAEAHLRVIMGGFDGADIAELQAMQAVAPEGMNDAVLVYVEHIEGLLKLRPDFVAVEQRIDLSHFHPELFGTADFVCYFAATKTLHVVDYKHGQGVVKAARGNPQLMYYGLGALVGGRWPVDKIVLTIVQPRAYHPEGPIRSWECDPVTLTEFAIQLVNDARRTEDPHAPTNPGDHCRFCPAAPTCPALAEEAQRAVAVAFTDVSQFDPDTLAKYLEAIPRIKAWCAAVHEFAHQQAALGNLPTGYKLVEKRAVRKWAPGVSARDLYETFELTPDQVLESKLKTPAAVERLLKKDSKFLLEQLVLKESSGNTLVAVTDDREPVPPLFEVVGD